MATQIAHNGFAKAALMREKCHKEAECTWCGQQARWFYFWEGDDNLAGRGQRHGIGRYGLRPFCSVACYRTFNS